MKERIKKISNIFYGLVVAILLMVAGIVAVSILNMPGNFKFLVVQSGSMAPAIQQGAIVVVRPQQSYQIGDIITTTKPTNPKVSITHRIFALENNNGETAYVTKGDANNGPDTEKRPRSDVIGKTIFSVPYLGFLVSFAKTRNGLILLIVLPAIIIAYTEILSIKNECVRLVKERTSSPKQKDQTEFKDISTT